MYFTCSDRAFHCPNCTYNNRKASNYKDRAGKLPIGSYIIILYMVLPIFKNKTQKTFKGIYIQIVKHLAKQFYK